MAPENFHLMQRDSHKFLFWSRILICACGAMGLAITLSTHASTMSFTTPTRAAVATPAAVSNGFVQQTIGSQVVERSSHILEAAQDPSLSGSGETLSASSASPSAICMVAATSTLLGALAMKLWNQQGKAMPAVIPVDMDSMPTAGVAPIVFRTSAPWMGSSSEDRGSRMVLQAAKGKGKGGGAKGKIAGIIKLALPAGKATPAPPVGPALGQYGLNIVAFCKEYNAATEKEAADGMIIPVEITAFEDRSYKFILKTPPASVLLRKAANVPRGSATPNKEKVGSITIAQLEEIAKTKLPDLNTNDVQKAMKIVEGTAKNMGITIKA